MNSLPCRRSPAQTRGRPGSSKWKSKRLISSTCRSPRCCDIGDGSQDACWPARRGGRLPKAGANAKRRRCRRSRVVMSDVAQRVQAGERLGALGKDRRRSSDIQRIGRLVPGAFMDLLQADHTLSGSTSRCGICWGTDCDEPVYKLLDIEESFPKVAYASLLFGDDPQTTRPARAGLRGSWNSRRDQFGWGPFGAGR